MLDIRIEVTCFQMLQRMKLFRVGSLYQINRTRDGDPHPKRQYANALTILFIFFSAPRNKHGVRAGKDLMTMRKQSVGMYMIFGSWVFISE